MIELVEDRYAWQCIKRASLQKCAITENPIAHQTNVVNELRDSKIANTRSVMICEKIWSYGTTGVSIICSKLRRSAPQAWHSMRLVVSWALSKVENCSLSRCHACWQSTATISYWLIHVIAFGVWLFYRIFLLSFGLWAFMMAQTIHQF